MQDDLGLGKDELKAQLDALREALAASEAGRLAAERERDQYRAIFEQAPLQLAALWGPDRVYTFSNAVNRDFIGHDVTGRRLAEALSPQDVALLTPFIDQVYATGEPFIVTELPAPRPDGTPAFINGIYQPIRGASGEVEGLLSLAIDVTAYVSAAKSAQESEEALRRLVDHAAREARASRRITDMLIESSVDGVLAFDEDHRYTIWNPAMERLTGLKAEQVLGRRASEIFPFLVATGEMDRFDDALAGRPAVARSRPFTIPETGREGYFDAHYTPLRDDAGAIVGGAGIIRDVTEHHRMQEALAERSAELQRQHDLLERVVANAPTGLAYMDRSYTVRWINPAYLRFTGRDAEYFLNRRLFSDFGSDDQTQAVAPGLREVFETGQIQAFHGQPFPGVDDEGNPRMGYWDIIYVPVTAPTGEVDGALVFAQDVSGRETEKRVHAALIEELRRQDSYKDEFVSVVSHELRTPLNFIMGFASVLEDELAGPLNPEQHLQVGKILFGADRMLRLVNDLLDFAKLQAGKFTIFREAVALGPVVDGAVAALEPLAAAKGIVVEAQVEVPLALEADGGRIEQVITNLLSNAIKFTGPGGRVTVTAHCEGEDVVIAVNDTGKGIPNEAMTLLFERFRQVDMSATRDAGGTGLGLAITKGLVEAHGGYIEAESEVGIGSTFRVVLPMACVDGERSLAT